MIIIERGRPVFRADDEYHSYEKGARKAWYSEVDENPHIIQCMVMRMDQFVVGLISSRVYPGLVSKS